MENKTILRLLARSSDMLKFYLVEQCDILLQEKEQRKLSVILPLMQTCNSLRGLNHLTKRELEKYLDSLNNIPLTNTKTAQKLKEDTTFAITHYDDFFDSNGIRKA